MIAKSGVDVMTPAGAWIPIEEDMFGEKWPSVIAKALKDLEGDKDNIDFGMHHAIKKMEDDGYDEDVIWYLRNCLGHGSKWWDFMIGTSRPVLVFATKKGFCKTTNMEDFAKIQKNGKTAITIRDNDALIRVAQADRFMLDGNLEVDNTINLLKRGVKEGALQQNSLDEINEFVDEFADFIFLTTAEGVAAKYPVHSMKVSGRTGQGVRGIKLKENDEVVGFDIVTNNDEILLVTESGKGKKVKVSDFRNMKRGAVGVKCLNVNAKTGKVVAAFSVKHHDDSLVFMTEKGQVIRMRNSAIPIYKRQAQGVKVVGLKSGDRLISGGVIDGKLLTS